MSPQLLDAWEGAALNKLEQRVIQRIVAVLRCEVGDGLLAVWLYGSRARGEADPSETDPDRRSDVDLLAVVSEGRDARQIGWHVQPLVEKAVDMEDDSPVYYSLRVFDTGWLRERREIRSFFVQEVDRDKLVLYGDRLDDLDTSGEAKA
jgi:predicted nucleotidyltransferase